jgi:hypothetical protein
MQSLSSLLLVIFFVTFKIQRKRSIFDAVQLVKIAQTLAVIELKNSFFMLL